MKLKQGLMTHEINGVQYLIPIGREVFSGVIRSNESAAFLVDLLKEETTEEALVDAMCREYDAPREVLAADVTKILEILRRANALEE
jgi:hypothetical protein